MWGYHFKSFCKVASILSCLSLPAHEYGFLLHLTLHSMSHVSKVDARVISTWGAPGRGKLYTYHKANPCSRVEFEMLSVGFLVWLVWKGDSAQEKCLVLKHSITKGFGTSFQATRWVCFSSLLPPPSYCTSILLPCYSPHLPHPPALPVLPTDACCSYACGSHFFPVRIVVRSWAGSRVCKVSGPALHTDCRNGTEAVSSADIILWQWQKQQWS